MSWYQQALTPPEVHEVVLRIGVIPSADHWQWMAEAKDPTTGILTAQISGPHGSLSTLPGALAAVFAKVEALVLDPLEPF